MLTSRSTVLNQARRLSDLYDINNTDRSEYLLSITSFSKKDRARILYANIWFSDLPEEYVDQIYEDKRYIKIIDHRNYNPRIISFITDYVKIQNITPSEYWIHVENSLDNPQGVWKNVFENQLDDMVRLMVCLVVINDQEIFENELKHAFCDLAVAAGFTNSLNAGNAFASSLRVAVGAVLSRSVGDSQNENRISLFNPSVADFILQDGQIGDELLRSAMKILRTPSSINNVANLAQNDLITDALRDQVFLEYLNNTKNAEIAADNGRSFLNSLDTIVKSQEPVDNIGKNALFEIIELFDEIEPGECNLEIVASIFNKFIECDFGREVEEAMSAFYSRNDWDHCHMDELNCTITVLVNFRYIDTENLIAAINTSVHRYVNEELEQFVHESGVLEDFLDDEQMSDAHVELYDFLSEALSQFGFSDQNIETLCERIDILDVIQQNKDAYIDAIEPDDWHDRGSSSGLSDNAYIENLFDRS